MKRCFIIVLNMIHRDSWRIQKPTLYDTLHEVLIPELSKTLQK